MKLGIFTIVLDGMPFIQHHLHTFQQLPFDWVWSVAEGASMNGADTRWCKSQEPRSSSDGTIEYLRAAAADRNLLRGQVCLVSRPSWENKTEMCNVALESLSDCDILLQVDVDEFHTVENIVKIVQQFHTYEGLSVARIPCRYFVGPDLICQGEGCWSNRVTEWIRAWRYKSKYRFSTHEPPLLWPRDSIGRIMTRKQATLLGLSFDHYAYVLPKQVEYKEKFYGYAGLVDKWKALQEHQTFPVPLNEFFSFVDPNVTVKRLAPAEVPAILKACSHS